MLRDEISENTLNGSNEKIYMSETISVHAAHRSVGTLGYQVCTVLAKVLQLNITEKRCAHKGRTIVNP